MVLQAHTLLYPPPPPQQVCAVWLTQASHLPFLHPADHKGPEAVDYRWRDALNRLMHPHLLANCGPT